MNNYVLHPLTFESLKISRNSETTALSHYCLINKMPTQSDALMPKS